MQKKTNPLTRRTFAKLAGITAASWSAPLVDRAAEEPRKTISLFDGHTLDDWTQIENSATSLSSGGITDQAAFTAKLANGPDAVSTFLRGQLEDSVKADLASYSASNPNAKAIISALVKDLNRVISGPSIYDKARFGNIVLRPETKELLNRNPQGPQLGRLNKLLLEDAYPAELAKSALTGWVVQDDAMASTGAGRGVIYTAKDYSHFRLMFTMRHVSGNPDHQACVLIFCTRPQAGEKPLDALGGIQFQVPKGGHWDYRPGMNNSGGAEFTAIGKPQFDVHAWSRVEILADAAQGTARMAVAQPPGAKAVEVLAFQDPGAGKPGPIAWQMHNAGLIDEYKDVTVELDPKTAGLISA
jgi:3-keto-disaccharide hydrolase